MPTVSYFKCKGCKGTYQSSDYFRVKLGVGKCLQCGHVNHFERRDAIEYEVAYECPDCMHHNKTESENWYECEVCETEHQIKSSQRLLLNNVGAPMQDQTKKVWDSNWSSTAHRDIRISYHMTMETTDYGMRFVVHETADFGNYRNPEENVLVSHETDFKRLIGLYMSTFLGSRPYDDPEYLFSQYTSDELQEYLEKMRQARENLERMVLDAHTSIDTLTNTINEVFALKLEGRKPEGKGGNTTDFDFDDDIPF